METLEEAHKMDALKKKSIHFDHKKSEFIFACATSSTVWFVLKYNNCHYFDTHLDWDFNSDIYLLNGIFRNFAFKRVYLGWQQITQTTTLRVSWHTFIYHLEIIYKSKEKLKLLINPTQVPILCIYYQ